MDEHPKQHAPPQWTGVKAQHGNGTIFVRSNLFVFLLGQISLALIGLAGFAVTYGQNTQKFIELSNRVGGTEAVAKRMDENGTNFSHYNIISEGQRLASLEARANANEEQVKRIAVIDEKVSRIDKTVDEIRLTLTRK